MWQDSSGDNGDSQQKKSRKSGFFLCLFLKKILPIWDKCTKMILGVVKSGVKWVKMGGPVAIKEKRMFIGEYSHTIDTKGRLIVPSKFREQLGEEFVVTKGLDGCLFVYENSEWKSFEEKLRALPLTNANARKFTRFFLAGASACEVDRQGRILIPAVLRDFAQLEKDVVLVGVGSRIEIWNKAIWAEKNVYDDMEEIAENMEGLGI